MGEAAAWAPQLSWLIIITWTLPTQVVPITNRQYKSALFYRACSWSLWLGLRILVCFFSAFKSTIFSLFSLLLVSFEEFLITYFHMWIFLRRKKVRKIRKKVKNLVIKALFTFHHPSLTFQSSKASFFRLVNCPFNKFAHVYR